MAIANSEPGKAAEDLASTGRLPQQPGGGVAGGLKCTGVVPGKITGKGIQHGYQEPGRRFGDRGRGEWPGDRRRTPHVA